MSRLGISSNLRLPQLGGLVLVIAGCATTPRAPETSGRFELLASASLSSQLEFAGTRVGGLSGIFRIGDTDRYRAISDDPSEHAPARAYELSIERSSTDPSRLDVEVLDVTTLHGEDGRTFARGTIDPEGIVAAEGGSFWVSSEGNARARIAPTVTLYDSGGRPLRALEVPAHYHPEPDLSGVRDNLAFESLSEDPSGRFLFTATEGAIHEDGPPADVGVRTPARILRYDQRHPDSPPDEYRYWAEAVVRRPALPGAFRIAGLVELLALDRHRLLALERSFGVGTGYSIRLWETSIADADPLGPPGAVTASEESAAPAAKRRLLDFRDLGIAPRNLEGMTFGPELPDGRRTLVVVSDNNFRDGDETQIFWIAIEP